MAAKSMGTILQTLADEFHRREENARIEAIDDRTCGRPDQHSKGMQTANASGRQLVLDTMRKIEKGEIGEKKLPREAFDLAREIAHRLQPFISDEDARKVMPLLEGWVRLTVGPIIEEREEAVGDVFELEKPWQGRLSRFLRKLADLVRDS